MNCGLSALGIWAENGFGLRGLRLNSLHTLGVKLTVFSLLVVALLAGVVAPVVAKAEGSNLQHYIEENSDRYEAFRAENPEMPFDRVVAYVNAGADKAYYSDIVVVDRPSDLRVLLSKNFALPYGYEPPDLVELPGGHLLRKIAASAFEDMRDAARDEGLNLVIRSSYRSHGSQVASYNLVAENYGVEGAEISVARPGHSEHQTGLALDIMHREGTTGPLTVQGFEYSNEYFWLLEHGHEYGFILRYPEGYTQLQGFVYEPWHWRYVGKKVSMSMFRWKIATFEEYYGRYLAKPRFQRPPPQPPAIQGSIRALPL